MWAFVVFSWYAWDYGGGNRPMVETSTILALMLAAGLEWAKNIFIKSLAAILIILVIVFNLMQSWLTINSIYQNGFPNSFKVLETFKEMNAMLFVPTIYESHQHLKSLLIKNEMVILDTTFKFSDSTFVNNEPNKYRAFKGIFQQQIQSSIFESNAWCRLKGSGYYECKNPLLANRCRIVLTVSHHGENYFWQGGEMPINTLDSNKISTRTPKEFAFDFNLGYLKNPKDTISVFF